MIWRGGGETEIGGGPQGGRLGAEARNWAWLGKQTGMGNPAGEIRAARAVSLGVR